MTSKSFTSVLPWALALALLAALSFYIRDYIPIDETRYVSVAWEMWLRGDFLVPFKNGEAYSHKPPLLFWLYQAGWWVLGVNDWWPRVVSTLLSLGGIVLSVLMARRLWPGQEVAGRMPAILLATLLWTVFSLAAMFDMLMAFCTLLGLHGLLRAGSNRRSGWWQYGLAIGLGILAKGPAILLHLLPVALLAPWWLRPTPVSWKKWYAAIGWALLGGIALALAWAIPAAIQGGEAYAHAIFWGQTANRMADSFAHKRPVWWYLPLLPVLLFPWFIWSGFWRGYLRLRQQRDFGTRFALAWFMPAFIAFSLVSGKQPHYLLPELPAFALLVARAVGMAPERATRAWGPGLFLVGLGVGMLWLPQWQFSDVNLAALPIPLWPSVAVLLLGILLLSIPAQPLTQVRRLALAGLALMALLLAGPLHALAPAYDMRPFAQAIAKVQQSGQPVAHVGTYDAQYVFAARLRQPLQLIERRQIAAWAQAHPQGAMVAYVTPGSLPQSAQVLARHAYFKLEAVLLSAPEASRLQGLGVGLNGP